MGKPFGKHSIEAMLFDVNACVENQGFHVGKETVPEVITNTEFLRSWKTFPSFRSSATSLRMTTSLTIMTYGLPSVFQKR